MTGESGSARLKALDKGHVLDEATRKRRQKKALEALERDNFQDDIPTTLNVSDFRIQLNKKFQQRFTVDETTPNANETNPKDDSLNNPNETSLNTEPSTAKKRKFKSDFKYKFRKNYATLADEEVLILLNLEFIYQIIQFKFLKPLS
jgi:zinc finger HIT domain-containing protein 1